MKSFLLLLTAMLLLITAAATESTAIDKAKQRFPLEQKLLGEWQGGPCQGNFVFHANGTYELTSYGPGGAEYAGVWEVQWDALPPTLVLTCKSADLEEEEGEVWVRKLIELDDEKFTIDYVHTHGTSTAKYKRLKK